MKVKIEFEIELPDIDHSEQQLEDFLRYELNDNGVLLSGNPFRAAGADVEPIFGTFEYEKL